MAAIRCTSCDAVCCRLTVVLDADDDVPPHLTTRLPEGPHVMAHDEDGWCAALDARRMNCRIYDSRPAVCRVFVMGGPYCSAVRDEYRDSSKRDIALTLIREQ